MNCSAAGLRLEPGLFNFDCRKYICEILFFKEATKIGTGIHQARFHNFIFLA